MSVLSVSRCLSLSKPKPEILVSPLWITARDLSAAGGTKRDLRKLGLIRNTSPDLLSQSGIRPRCVHVYAHTAVRLCMCLIPPRSRSHTDLFTPPWTRPRPRRQDRLTGGRITLRPHTVISIVSHGTLFTATFTRHINGASGQKIYSIDFFTSGFIFCCVKSRLQQRSLCRI